MRVLFQARLFQDPFQHHFPPVPLSFGASLQRLGQVVGLCAYLVGLFYQSPDPFLQGGALFCILNMSGIHPAFEINQLFSQGLEQLLHALLAGFFKFQGIRFQYLVGKVLKLDNQLFLRIGQFLLL